MKIIDIEVGGLDRQIGVVEIPDDAYRFCLVTNKNLPSYGRLTWARRTTGMDQSIQIDCVECWKVLFAANNADEVGLGEILDGRLSESKRTVFWKDYITNKYNNLTLAMSFYSFLVRHDMNLNKSNYLFLEKIK